MSHALGLVPPTSRCIIRSSGPRTARPPISGLTATARDAARLERGADAGDGEDRVDRDERVARGDHDRVGRRDRLEDAGRRARRVGAVVDERVDLVLVLPGDEPLLEGERALAA